MHHKFPPLPRKHDRVSRGIIHNNNNFFSPDEFFVKLNNHLSHNLSDLPNFYGVSLLVMNSNNLKNTAVLFQDKLLYDRHSIYFQS